jgi:hypothetical protein
MADQSNYSTVEPAVMSTGKKFHDFRQLSVKIQLSRAFEDDYMTLEKETS